MLAVIASSLVVAGFVITGSHLLLAATAIGTIIFAVRHRAWKAPLTLIPAASAVTLVLSLAWWRMAPSAAAAVPLGAFAVILVGLAVGFADPRGRGTDVASVSWPASCRPSTTYGAGRGKVVGGRTKSGHDTIGTARAGPVTFAVFLTAGCVLLGDLGGYRPGEPILELLAHHWGAYIGSALHLKAGLVPFYDVPLQYGLGPTLAIAAACGGADCWGSTECVVIVLDLANALLILRMVLATAVPRGRMWQYAATIVVFAAVFLWTGVPADGSGVLATPSAGGIRFLPVTLVACLLFFGRPAAAAAALVPAVLWSPESAAMSVAVFGLCETARIGLARAALRSGALLVGSYAGLVLLHHATFGVWMDPLAFAEYVLHVPGSLPVNPFSDAMLLAAVLGLGGWLMIRVSPDPVTACRDRAATVLLFAAASYWFGRSHPNNVCNLAPFLVLVAFRVLDRPGSLLADVTGFGLAVSVAALAMSPWHSVPYDPGAVVDIRRVVANFPSLEPDIEQIRRQITHQGDLGIADFGPSYTRHASETLIWTPMDPSSLWGYVPGERRQLYIRRSVARLRRSGWAIAEDDQAFLLDDLRAGYAAAQRRSFLGAPSPVDGSQKHYVAVCFDPRPEIAPSIVGSACPSGTP